MWTLLKLWIQNIVWSSTCEIQLNQSPHKDHWFCWLTQWREECSPASCILLILSLVCGVYLGVLISWGGVHGKFSLWISVNKKLVLSNSLSLWISLRLTPKIGFYESEIRHGAKLWEMRVWKDLHVLLFVGEHFSYNELLNRKKRKKI